MDGLPGRALGAACLLLLAAGWLGPEAWGSPTPPPSPAAPPPPLPPGAPGGSQDTCTSCGGFRRPEELGRVDGDFLEAVKRHILNRLQMRGRPNITHTVPKAAMVTALRKLHAGKVREDGRVEIPHLDGHASPGADGQERVSEIISFAETGGSAQRAALAPPSTPFPPALAAAAAAAAAASAPWGEPGLPAQPARLGPCALRPGRRPLPSGSNPFPLPYPRRGVLCFPPLLSETGPSASGCAPPSRPMRAALAPRAFAR